MSSCPTFYKLQLVSVLLHFPTFYMLQVFYCPTFYTFQVNVLLFTGYNLQVSNCPTFYMFLLGTPCKHTNKQKRLLKLVSIYRIFNFVIDFYKQILIYLNTLSLQFLMLFIKFVSQKIFSMFFYKK